MVVYLNLGSGKALSSNQLRAEELLQMASTAEFPADHDDAEEEGSDRLQLYYDNSEREIDICVGCQ